MPISSNQISNIISGQVGMFSASAQYAQAISNQYGFQSSGSVGIVDPRDKSAQHLGAGNAGAFGARMPGMAAGAAGMAAMFGYAPRVLDPFTATFNAGRMGMAGAGMAGGIGMAGMTAGAYMGIGQAGAFATNNMVTGAQNRGLLNNQMGQIFPNMNSRGLNAMSGQVESMQRQGMGSIRELASLMQQGAATGALDTGSLSQFSSSFRKLVGNVREVANVLNSTLTEASQAISSVKSIGVKSNEAAQFLGAARGIGATANLSPGQMMGVAQAGSQFGFQTGISRQQGAMGAMVSAGVYGMAQQNERLGVDGGSQGRYTQAATRFLLSNRGKTVLGAMMNSEGGFDSRTAEGISQGVYSKSQLQEMYSENINSTKMRRMLRSRGTEIAGEFISQFGPQGISGSLEAMTRGRDADGNSQNSEMLQQSLTGLNRRDIDSMRQLAAHTPMLRQKLIQEARAGFAEGQQSASGMQMMGIAFDKMIKPLKDQFRKMGASMTEAVSGAMEDVTTQFVTGKGQRGISSSFSNYQDMYRSSQISENKVERGMYQQTGGPASSQMMFNTMPQRASGLGSFLNYLPSGLRAGGMPEGSSIGDLSMGGLSTLNPRDAMAVGGAGLALRANVFPGGRNVVGATGQAMSMTGRQLGRGVDKIFPGAANQGFMRSLGGVGTVSGAARFPGGMMRLGGMSMRGIGAVGRFASLPMMAYGMAGAVQDSQRMMGRDTFKEGAFAGNEARMLHALREMGSLGDTHMPLSDITGAGASLPGSPISGLYNSEGESSGSGGHQYSLTSAGREKLEGILSTDGKESGGARAARLAKRFGAGDLDSIVRGIEAKDIGERITSFSKGVKDLDPSLTQDQIAALSMHTKGVIPPQTRSQRRQYNKNVMGRKEAYLADLQGSEDPSVKGLGRILGNNTASKQLHAAQESFIKNGDKGNAGLFVDAALDNIDEGGNDTLRSQIMDSLGGEGPLTPAIRDANKRHRIPTYGTQMLSAFEQVSMVGDAENSEDQFKANIGENRASAKHSLRQGSHYLGMYGTNAGSQLDAIINAEPGQTDDLIQGNNNSIVRHLFDENARGNHLSEYALGRARQEFGNDRTGLGQKRSATAVNAHRAISDMNSARKPGKTGSNARFLSKQARRMGLDIDFTKYKSEDDRMYLSGKKSGDNRDYAISHKLEDDLRSFGRQLHELNTGTAASDQDALNARNTIMDSLQDGSSEGMYKAVEKLSSYTVPSSPTSGKAASGGLQQQVGAVDQALSDLVTIIEDKTKTLRAN